MTMPLHPILGPATQLGFVVRDVEAAMRHWIEVFGVGPFVCMERGVAQPPSVTWMRGAPVTVELKLAFGFMGDVQV
ncbi:MAG: VOC family protein [Aquamicrobium sp.]|nr:VOC family protein [Aquamicrobium sp.]